MGDYDKLERAKEVLKLYAEDLFQYGGHHVLNVIRDALFPERDDKEENSKKKVRTEIQVKLATEMLMGFEKRAVLEVINDILYSPEADLKGADPQSEDHTEDKKPAVQKKHNNITELKKQVDQLIAATPSPSKPKRKQNDQAEPPSPSNRPKKLRRAKQTN